jgi:hypothetical protein
MLPSCRTVVLRAVDSLPFLLAAARALKAGNRRRKS